MRSASTRPVLEHDRFIDIGGTRFHCRDVGDPEAPPVLLLHGIMGHAREWDTLIEAMAPPYRLIVLDQRGHGRSDWARSYTAAEMADDMIRLSELIGLRAVSVIGHSMGGMAATIATAERPDLVDRLVVVDIGPDALTTEFAAEAPGWMRAMAETSYASVDEAVAEWQAGNPLAREDLLRHYVEHCLVPRPGGGLGWCFDATGLTSFFTNGVTEAELWDAIDHIVVPTLLLRGEHSPILSPATAAAVVERLRSGRLAEIPAGGHDLGVEQPEAVAQAALSFLTESRSRGSRG